MTVLKQLLAELEARALGADSETYEDPMFVRLTPGEVDDITASCPAAIGRDAGGTASCLGLLIIDVAETAYPDRVRGLGEHWMARRTPLGDGRGYRFETTTMDWRLRHFGKAWVSAADVATGGGTSAANRTDRLIDWAKWDWDRLERFSDVERRNADDWARTVLDALEDPAVTHLQLMPPRIGGGT